MATEALPELDAQYRVLREEAGILDRSSRGKLAVRGAEAADYLQGQLTNDVEGLEPGRGLLCALLDRKGHIQADMPGYCGWQTDEFWLDTEGPTAETLRRHLETYKIGREVEIADAHRPSGRSSRCSGRARRDSRRGLPRPRAQPRRGGGWPGSQAAGWPPTSGST